MLFNYTKKKLINSTNITSNLLNSKNVLNITNSTLDTHKTEKNIMMEIVVCCVVFVCLSFILYSQYQKAAQKLENERVEKQLNPALYKENEEDANFTVL